MVKRYGDDAMLEAAERADQPLDEGDIAGAETWHRILSAIERLRAQQPGGGDGCTLGARILAQPIRDELTGVVPKICEAVGSWRQRLSCQLEVYVL